MLSARLVTGPSMFDELKGDWQDLVSCSPTATPFQTWEWHSTWYEFFGAGKKPLAYALYEGSDLVGLFPMVRGLAPWRTLRPSGIGPSDYLHPLARAGYENAFAEHLCGATDEMTDVDLLDFHQLRESRELPAALGGEPLVQATCLLLDLPKTYDAYLAMLGKSLRYDIRKLDKNLFSSGRATIESVPPENVRQGMEVLFDQHRRRWRKRGLPGAFVGRTSRFHHKWAQTASRNGWLWLSVLRVDGGAVGAIYAMALADTCYYYQAGFDPAASAVSPGTLLVAHSIRRAIDEGKAHFDFMRGDEPYKRRWKPQHALRNLRFVRPSGRMRGRLACSWNIAGSQLESRIRARLEGRGLL